MKRYFEKLAKRLILWAFSGRIRVFYYQQILSDHDLVTAGSKFGVEKMLKQRMVDGIVRQLESEGFIDWSERTEPRNLDTIYQAKIYSIK